MRAPKINTGIPKATKGPLSDHPPYKAMHASKKPKKPLPPSPKYIFAGLKLK